MGLKQGNQPRASGSVADAVGLNRKHNRRTTRYDYNVSIPRVYQELFARSIWRCVLGSISSHSRCNRTNTYSWAISTKTAPQDNYLQYHWLYRLIYAQELGFGDVSFTDRVFIIILQGKPQILRLWLKHGNYIWQKNKTILATMTNVRPMIAYGLFYSDARAELTIAYNIHILAKENGPTTVRLLCTSIGSNNGRQCSGRYDGNSTCPTQHTT